MKPPLKDRLLAKALIINDEKSCWEWQGGKDKDGYGRIGDEGKTKRTHRVSWEVHFGPIPEENCVCHHCDNPPCIRPDHLFLGTVYDNNHDKEKKNRQVRGESNGMRKLSDIEILEIRELYSAGKHTQKDLGEIFGVSPSAISRIVGNKRWNHVGEFEDWFQPKKEKGRE